MTGPQEILECDGSRCGSVVEKDGNGSIRAVAMYITIGDAGVDALIINVVPVRSTRIHRGPQRGSRAGVVGRAVRRHHTVATAPGSVTRGLMRRQNDEAQTFIDQGAHHGIVAGSFRKPHCFGFTSEAMAKISLAPTNLRPQVARIAQRQNRVSISLSNRVPMSVTFQSAFAIRVNDARVCVRVISLE